ncbi:MAG: NrfD/PsrC family molybdoenzyme membrane anchor subunit, partial [Limisphaerales bacterium]
MAESAIKFESPARAEALEALAPPVELRRMTPVPRQSLAWLTDRLTAFNEGKTPVWWWMLFMPTAFCAMVVLPVALIYKISVGVGVWGNNMPVMWGWDIINFVWWVGVAHAGTLISAMLFLTRQHWRTVIGRAAEAMTVFSVAMAGLYPAIHVGRAWFDWFMVPLPWYEDVWPNFRSPLMWDVFAVNTYLIVSTTFWYMGLIPDLALMRDRAKTSVRKFLYGIFALGWTGSARQWHNYEKAYLVLSGLCTLLVFT